MFLLIKDLKKKEAKYMILLISSAWKRAGLFKAVHNSVSWFVDISYILKMAATYRTAVSVLLQRIDPSQDIPQYDTFICSNR